MPLHGPEFGRVQRQLSHFNHNRLTPVFSRQEDLARGQGAQAEIEQAFVASVRAVVAPLVRNVPTDADAFVAWFEALGKNGPGQGDPLFPWLAAQSTLAEMKWFLTQEVAGEAGFEDLLALTQVKMPTRAKLEMARNYWDEMGRGNPSGMHGPMLERLAAYLAITPTIDDTVSESLALGNLMMALACNRDLAFHAVGALGVIELTAPGRARCVSQGLDRLGVPKKQSHYFALHGTLDVKHSIEWNKEVLWPLVAEDERRARAIAEGAVMRLWCGARCFARYRAEFAI